MRRTERKPLLLLLLVTTTILVHAVPQPTIPIPRRRSRNLVDPRRFRGGESSSTPPATNPATKGGPKGGGDGAVRSAIKNYIASGLAAACAKTLLAPFDTVKTMQQHLVRDVAAGDAALSLAEAARVVMRRPRGFLELYAGLGVAALGSMPSVGLYFGVYDYSKTCLYPFYLRTLSSPNSTPSSSLVRTLTVATSAAIGNTVASFSRVPHEVVKQRLQTGRYPGAVTAIRDMWGKGGVGAFFPTGGVRIQMIRDIPYAIVTLLVYESLKEHWVNVRSHGSGSDSTARIRVKEMVAGGVSGGIGSFVTNPMDVIKTRLQTDSGMYGGEVLRCVRATYAEGGAGAFLRGSIPRLVHKVPANASFFLFYEFFRRVLNVGEDGGNVGVGVKGDGSGGGEKNAVAENEEEVLV